MATAMTATAAEKRSLGSSWRDSSIEIERIRAEITRLWIEWDVAHADEMLHIGSSGTEQVYMRPSTMNVVAVTETAAQAMRTGTVLGLLPDYTPSRSIVLARSADADGEEPYGIDIRIGERTHLQGAAPVRVEIITIMAPPGNDEVLASIAEPLLVADLPDVVFVPGEPIAANDLVSDLLENADGLLVDTVSSVDTGQTLAFLVATMYPFEQLGLGDLVWTRIRIWRELVAQFFDQPSAAASLDAIDHVDIEYSPVAEDGRSGLTAALMMAGWLATRLDWKAPGDLVADNDGYRLTLRAGGLGKGREVVLRLNPGAENTPCSSLKRVRLAAEGQPPAEFIVDRHDAEAIATFSQSSNTAGMSRVVHSGCPDDSVILAAKLRRLRVDPVYREALAFASVLWPPGFEAL